jgi:hypothetical protein
MGGPIHSLLASVAVLGCCLTLGEAGNLRVSRELQGGAVTCNPKEFEGEGFTGCKVLDEQNLALHWKADDDGKWLGALHATVRTQYPLSDRVREVKI